MCPGAGLHAGQRPCLCCNPGALTCIHMLCSAAGWRLVEAQGLAPPGYTDLAWREVTTPSAVPVIAGQLVEQPDGRVHAIHLDVTGMSSLEPDLVHASALAAALGSQLRG